MNLKLFVRDSKTLQRVLASSETVVEVIEEIFSPTLFLVADFSKTHWTITDCRCYRSTLNTSLGKMSNQASYEEYRRQDVPRPMSRHSSDNIQRVRAPELTSPHHQRTVSATPYPSSRAPPLQQYRSSPKPQQRSVSSPQQRARSPIPVSPVDKERPSRRRDKPSSNVPPVSKYSYEPYRANTSVFEESEDDILARKRATKAAKISKNNSKFGLFGSGKKIEPVASEPVGPYLHRSGSGDSLELMPTIAMGYENSMDKQMRHRQMPGGELRITGQGYYFRANEEEDEGEEVIGDYDDGDVHEAYKMDVEEERVDSHGNELQRPVFVERERSCSRGRGAESQNREVSRSRSASPHPEMGAVQEVMGKKEVKKLGLFKKLLGGDKSKKSKKKENKEKKDKKIPTDAHKVLLEERGVPLPQINTQDHHLGSETSSPTTPSVESPTRVTFDTVDEEEEHAVESVQETATLVDVLGSIPVISVVFAKIDENEHLSEQTKLVIKFGVIVWVMYEMQMIFESVGRVFGR